MESAQEVFRGRVEKNLNLGYVFQLFLKRDLLTFIAVKFRSMIGILDLQNYQSFKINLWFVFQKENTTGENFLT